MAPLGRVGPTAAVVFALTCAAALAAAGASGAASLKTKRVSVSSAGAQGNASSDAIGLSPNGRFVVFRSNATNLVPGDTNGQTDIFVRNRKTGITKRMSLGPGGVQADGSSYDPEISADGRFVVFASNATNLVPNDTNGRSDIFVRDRKLRRTYRVSVGPGGVEADGGSSSPSISANGRFVVWDSSATNFVAGDTNATLDVFVRDRKKHKTTRVSVSSAGAQGNSFSVACYGYAPAISADGSIVAFESNASNLVKHDTNATGDIFVRNRTTGKTKRVSVARLGGQANSGSSYCSISGGGNKVVFETSATNLVPHDTNGQGDVFVRNWVQRKTMRASLSSRGKQAADWAGYSGISPDGRFVVFMAGEDAILAPHDSNHAQDAFVRDLRRRVTKRISRSAQPDPAGSGFGWISTGGRFVAFESDASDHVPHDTNAVTDVFVRGPYHW